MSLKVLISGPKGSGKSTLAKNIYKFYKPSKMWVFFDRGLNDESRHAPSVISKEDSKKDTHYISSRSLEIVLKVRKYLDTHKRFGLLEYLMFILTPIYAKGQLNLANSINAEFLINAQPLYMRNLMKIGKSAAKIKPLRSILEWPYKYDLIFNVLISTKEAAKRLKYREGEHKYFDKFVKEESTFQKYVVNNYTNIVNVDGFKPSYDLSTELLVYAELMHSLNKLITEAPIIPIKNYKKSQLHYSESETVKEYFSKEIEPPLKELYKDSNDFVDYVLEVYDRQHLFVFTHILSKSADYKESKELSSILFGVWGYLLWFDDVVDNAVERNNKQTLVGVDTSEADEHLAVIKDLATIHLGKNQSLWLSKALTITKDSMLRHAALGLGANYISILANYLDRGYSYIVWPTSLLSRGLLVNEKIPLYRIQINKHIGGQILNDMNDIVMGKFNDIQNGQITIPIALLRDSCNRKEFKFLKSRFGAKLSDGDKETLDALFSKYEILGKSQRLANSCLETAVESIKELNDKSLNVILDWINERRVY